MATTTFSGPIKTGTIRDTTGTTVGTNVSNVGSVVMASSQPLTSKLLVQQEELWILKPRMWEPLIWKCSLILMQTLEMVLLEQQPLL